MIFYLFAFIWCNFALSMLSLHLMTSIGKRFFVNYPTSLVYDKVEKRVAKNLLCDSCLTLEFG